MLTVSPTLKRIINKTLPLMLGLFAIMLVQLVDSIFISLLGVDQLAVHGITLPFQTVLVGLQVGIGVATTAIISQAKGAKQFHKATSTATISVLVGVMFIGVICLILGLLNDSILKLFVDSEVSVKQFSQLQALFNGYWPVWLLSALSVAALYLVTCVSRANGDSKTTGKLFVSASIINLILDPILMFSLKMGIEGAAVASIIGYSSSTVYILLKPKLKPWFNPISFDTTTFTYLVDLIKVSIPTIANQLIPAASAFVSMILIARIGTDAIAFWSLLARMESFVLVFTLALTMSLPPMIGHCLGAGDYNKINNLTITTAKFLLLFHVFVAFILSLGAGLFSELLSEQVNIQHWLETALRIIPFSYGPLGICMVVVSVFNALGMPKKALWVSIIRLFILYIPAIWFGASSGSVVNTLIAATMANVLAGLFAWIKLRAHIKSPTMGKVLCS